jgi:hypothetical protein
MELLVKPAVSTSHSLADHIISHRQSTLFDLSQFEKVMSQLFLELRKQPDLLPF